MKCRKLLVLNCYRVRFLDLREPKPRTVQEQIHVMDSQWLDALGLLGQNVTGNIRDQYERAGYKVISVEPIKPKRVAEIDLCNLWEQMAPAADTRTPATAAEEDDAE